MIDIYGVVGRLIEPVENTHTATRLCGCGEYGFEESLTVYRLRAGESKYKPSVRHSLYCGGIEPLIGPKGLSYGSAMFCECRRVYNNKIVFALFYAA